MRYFRIVILSGLLIMSFMSCDKDEMLEMDWITFDQTDYSGWRNLMYEGRHLEAADLIEKWLERHADELNEMQMSVTLFHLASMYGDGGEFESAIDTFKKCKQKPVKEGITKWTGYGAIERMMNNYVGHWNAYVDATIAFLAKDKTKLIAARERLAQDAWAWGRVEIVDDLIANFFAPYSEKGKYILKKNELRNNTRSTQIKSIDPENADFEDLAVLKKAIGDAQIVLLGEPTHGNGSTLLAMSRITKFLHQEMGFDVLALEASTDDCQEIWQKIESGKINLDDLRSCLPVYYGNSSQMQSLWEYIESKIGTENPLMVVGIDSTEAEKDADQEDHASLIDEFEQKNKTMAKNLFELADNKYAGHKIVVWALSSWTCRNLQAVNQEKTMALQFGVPTFGDYLWEKFGKNLYSLSFTAYEGKYRLFDWADKVWNIPRAPEGSFDWICHEAGANNVYVNFRTIPDNHWLREKFIMRLLENSNLELIWPDHFDGVLFINSEEPVSLL